jgi:hypothetical protein
VFSFSEDTFVKNTLHEAVFANSLDVYISPSGGGSFSALFAHDGAAAIFGNVCWPGLFARPWYSNGVSELSRNSDHIHCARLDHWLTGSLPYIHPLYYSPINQTVHEAGLRFDAKEVSTNAEWIDYSYNVDFKAMDHLVDTALRLAGKAAYTHGIGLFTESAIKTTSTAHSSQLAYIVCLACVICLCLKFY